MQIVILIFKLKKVWSATSILKLKCIFFKLVSIIVLLWYILIDNKRVNY